LTERLQKRDVTGTMAKLLDHTNEERGMVVMPVLSRCVQAGEVHELVTTDHYGLVDRSRVDRVGFLGFVEVSRSGVIDVGDLVTIADRPVGSVVGFDDCHFPNHYNVLIEVRELQTAETLGLAVEDEVIFCWTRESVRR
jgi:hypothetical protein